MVILLSLTFAFIINNTIIDNTIKYSQFINSTYNKGRIQTKGINSTWCKFNLITQKADVHNKYINIS